MTAAQTLRISSGVNTSILVPHMGVLSGRFPRNSREAIEECFDANVPRLELDIHSLDGPDYIVYHDRRLESETDGSGSLGRATPDDVRRVQFRRYPGTRPPLLSEVVEMSAVCDTTMQLDWKDIRLISPERLRALINVVAPVRERIIVSTGQDWNLRRLYEADPSVPFGFDPGLYLDHGIEGTDAILPRAMGAYGYRDDHPMAMARGESTGDYLYARMSALVLQAPGAREFFLSYRMVLQMLDDGFGITAWLHERNIAVSVWTADYNDASSVAWMRRLIDAGVDRITTNTAPAWIEAFAKEPVQR